MVLRVSWVPRAAGLHVLSDSNFLSKRHKKMTLKKFLNQDKGFYPIHCCDTIFNCSIFPDS
jgi:hypothetical protein